jgi:hypothetical protein
MLLVAAGAAVFTARHVVTAGLCRMRCCSEGEQQDERRENCTQHVVLRCLEDLFLTEMSSSRRGLGWSRVNAGSCGDHHPEPGGRHGQSGRWKRGLRWGADLATRARDNSTQSRLSLAAGARLAFNVRRARGSHNDGRKGNPQHSRHEGERRQDTGGQGDHAARIRGSQGFVRLSPPMNGHNCVTGVGTHHNLFRIFRKYRLTIPTTDPRFRS